MTDMSLVSAVLPVTRALAIPNYVLFTSSARMLTLFVSSHRIFNWKVMAEETDEVQIPGQEPMPIRWIPSSFLQDENDFLRNYLVENGRSMMESEGILINTFEDFEHDTLKALNDGKVISTLPHVCEFRKQNSHLEESDEGAGEGLLSSGFRFLWVVKDKKVDRDDGEELDMVVGRELMTRLRERGLVMKSWVAQNEILRHHAIGGFVTHCGWNSIVEAIWNGVPILAWPQHGDQKINSSLVLRSGIGIWEERWGWPITEPAVKAEKIAARIKEMMCNELLRSRARAMKEAARNAIAIDGSSTKGLMELIGLWKNEGT
ncbi:UDP-glycosyltransferase 13-like [Punica granatum]|uniref:UDP-glycosyltransferase 13-like n=1 Tax=Punica granatum TaxID=22663 RepID=A0A6P8BXH8_PUNGR|nr:UDP-glycosyltransferase 13-like [Punica granatum]